MASGQKRIEWTLLTTHPVESFEAAKEVVQSYMYRWRIEEFHKTWKSGGCDIEASQLRSFDAFRRWGTVLAAVATRAERLRLLSREAPEIDAETEFTRDELDAAILITESKIYTVGAKLTLGQAVRMIAIYGGYMGRKSDGPPGAITIRRGLERIVPAAKAIAALRRCD
jgi:hypothetical protein